jgi:hypothetical protein
VADPGEELGLRPVERGEVLGPAALELERLGVGDRGVDLPGDEVEKQLVLGVQGPVRTDSGEEHTDLATRPAPGQRDHEGGRGFRSVGRRVRVERAGQEQPGERRRQPVRLLRPAGVQHLPRRHPRRSAPVQPRRDDALVVEHADERGPPGGVTAWLQQVDRGERDVVAAAIQYGHGGRTGLVDRGGVDRGDVAELAQDPQPALAQHPRGVLTDDAEEPLHSTGVAGQRAVGERVIGLLAVAAAFQEQQQTLVPGGVTGVDH